MKIVLIGYMGSGKTTVGIALAKARKLRFLDLDAYIVNAEGCSIAELFEKKGEIHFRGLEHRYLQEIMQKVDHFVLSTGGGTPCYGNNMEELLQGTSYVFYLKLSVSALVARLVKEKEHRPMITDIPDVDFPEFIGKHLFERSHFYEKAPYIIPCDGKKPIDIMQEITSKLI